MYFTLFKLKFTRQLYSLYLTGFSVLADLLSVYQKLLARLANTARR